MRGFVRAVQRCERRVRHASGRVRSPVRGRRAAAADACRTTRRCRRRRPSTRGGGPASAGLTRAPEPRRRAGSPIRALRRTARRRAAAPAHRSPRIGRHRVRFPRAVSGPLRLPPPQGSRFAQLGRTRRPPVSHRVTRSVARTRVTRGDVPFPRMPLRRPFPLPVFSRDASAGQASARPPPPVRSHARRRRHASNRCAPPARRAVRVRPVSREGPGGRPQ